MPYIFICIILRVQKPKIDASMHELDAVILFSGTFKF